MTSTLCCPTPDAITVGNDVRYPNPGKGCFVCNPPYAHPRDWEPSPNSDERQGRTLVLCFDGTGDSVDKDYSNVVQLTAMLMKDDPKKQVVYYQPGIGTYTNNVIKTPIIEAASKLGDQMFARSLGEHVKAGYEFLVQNYCDGDQICLFGFSRGAFTARALAGMIQKVGILPSRNLEQLPSAYALYGKEGAEGLRQSLQFKRTFSVDVRIKFIGVWDTVESVGLFEKRLPFCVSDNTIEHFRHAVSLDERRVKFTPTYYHFHGDSEPEKSGSVPRQLESHVDGLHVDATDVKEVFFAGAHCDVGGGSVLNGERHTLARIPLRWMVRECFKAKTGIIFDAHMLMHEIGMDIGGSGPTPEAPPLPPYTTQYLARPRPQPKPQAAGAYVQDMLSSSLRWICGTPSNDGYTTITGTGWQGMVSEGEPQEELNDAVSPIYDQLEKPHWQMMQWIPWTVKNDCADGSETGGSNPNLSSGRVMDKQVVERGVKIHRSVKTRILAKGPNGEDPSYLPKMRFRIGNDTRCLERAEWLAKKPAHFEWAD